jgi:1-hydroxycarotenoid 3,4-desaturase
MGGRSSGTRVAVIGAGIGGLAAALLLAARGLDVTVLERAAAPGGKLRTLAVAGHAVDAGPTVFTMRWVFDALFADAAADFAAHVPLRRLEVLARHAWSAEQRLDLYADPRRSEAAIGDFAGAAAARGYRDFRLRAARVHAALRDGFMAAPLAGPAALVRRLGPAGLGGLLAGAPFRTLWQALGGHFTDPRLRQLFGRYATYCGASPFAAPAMLMLIAHVEQEGVWRIEGGMHRLAVALADLAVARGAQLRCGAAVAEILVAGGRVAGVRLADGETVAAEAVVANADAAALAGGCFGVAAAAAVPAPCGPRSLSAITWAMVAGTAGFPLVHHNVFFAPDYAAEFAALFAGASVPAAPTVYVCAEDRDDAATAAAATERLLCLVNAPPVGDARPFTQAEIAQCTTRMGARLEQCGLTLRPQATAVTTPADFAHLFPATGGALYGRAVHGTMAAFRRPGAATTLPGLYLAGGSVHPGAGVPMAALSGRLAATRLLADLDSTSRSRRTAMPGGMPTRSAMTARLR